MSFDGFETIRNNTALKLVSNGFPECFSFETIRNNTALKPHDTSKHGPRGF